uniref:Putative YopX protein n=1 Tax=viral metagenome TaxID=1070528 RepID=A0A6M3IFQ4_9ZZZZ
MREIKFRVRDFFEEIWYFYNLLDFDCGKYKSVGGLCWDRDSIGLSTGLKDKNGVEIFEGDILLVEDEWTQRILDDGSGPREICNHLAPVQFDNGSFGVFIANGADTFRKGFWSFPSIEYEVGDDIKNLEVIGNIYSNPELLEE